ncbi:MAG: hypothetical protein L6R38_001497 [Xanthoria sp. 2 TBL-2021]|nr:MAG: hypothetical protein L6R38_001497 [Xanthoria sp. 2 TBL-2021]
MTLASGSSSDDETFIRALFQFKSSVVDLATRQFRCDTLTHDEQEQTRERARWSKYSDTFPAIGEDQARTLKATERARNESQVQINQAKQENEKAIDTIARIIFGTILGSRSEEVIALNEQIASLKLEFSHSQNRHEREIADLREELLRNISLADTKLEGKIANESVRINKLAKLTADQESIKADLDELSANKMDKIKAELESKVDEQSASMTQSLKADVINELQPRLTESIKSCYKPELDKLNDLITTQSTARLESLENHLNELRTETIASITSEVKPELDSLKSAVSTSNSTFATLKSEVSELSESICSIAEYHKVIKDPFQNMVRESKTRDQAVKQIVGQQEVLNTEQKSLKAQLDATENKIYEQLREQQQASPVNGCQTPSTVSEAHIVPLDQRLNRMDDNVSKLHSRFEAKEKVETDRDEAVSKEIGQVWNFLIQLERDIKSEAFQSPSSTSLEQVVDNVKKLGQDHQSQAEKCTQLYTAVAQLAIDIKTLNNAVILPNDEARQQLDQLRSDQLSTSAALQQIQAEVGMLNKFSDLSALRDQPHQNIQRSIHSVRHTSPQINDDDNVQPKIEALESKVDYFDTQVKALESTLSSHSSRFNNLSTEPMVKSVIHTLQQLYPLQALQYNQHYLKQEVGTIKQEAKQQILDIRQEISKLVIQQDQTEEHRKQELFNLAHKQEQLVHRLKAEREIDGQKVAEIHELVKALDYRRTSGPDAATSVLLSEHDDRIKDVIEELRHEFHDFKETVTACKETIERDISAMKTSVSQDQASGIKELKHAFHEFKETVTSYKETIERDTSALKTSIQAQAEDQRKLEEKVYFQQQETKRYMTDAVDAVSKTDLKFEDLNLRVEALERANASSKGEKIPIGVGETQGIAILQEFDTEVVEIPSGSDQEPVKPVAKRSRETSSRNGSVDRPPQKRIRTHLDKNGDHDYSEHSSPRISLEAKEVGQSSQQTSSPSSRPKRGRPAKVRAD